MTGISGLLRSLIKAGLMIFSVSILLNHEEVTCAWEEEEKERKKETGISLFLERILYGLGKKKVNSKGRTCEQ